MVEQGVAAALSPEPSGYDDRIVRYPTYTGDVAETLKDHPNLRTGMQE